MSLQGPVLALDYGARRIGIAVSDVEGQFAFPAGVLERSGLAKDLEALAVVIREREVAQVVVGLPIHLDGRKGPEAEAATKFARAVGEATGLPVALLDERWTSREAEQALRAVQPRRQKRQKAKLDAAAAALLLRTFLERERNARAEA
jgi:putative Holliday junction resolvase